jgi:hypothetical protein
MHAVLLAPGPSLRNLGILPDCDISVAINRAALFHPCTVFAASDYPMLRDWRHAVQGSPLLLTKRQTWEDKAKDWYEHAVIAETLDVPIEGWLEKTATISLGYLWLIGAKRVDVYGADWSDEPDFDGVRVVGTERDEKRWARERAVWGRMCEELGMEVVRR